jgi:hypothetical protein
VNIILVIGTDPAEWVLQASDLDAVAAQLTQATGPLVLPVISPLAGRLVLSAGAAATIALSVPSGVGWNPSDCRLPKGPQILYIPTLTGATRRKHGFALPPGTDLDALTQAIATAMEDSAILNVPLAPQGGDASLVLQGAGLAYAVVCAPAK